ncbi:MAG: sulfite exporter TauE/SafE family protein, partial [Micromonosporaceae bacterium]
MTFGTAGITAPLWLPFLWASLVGLVFSMLGAAGGILAAVGHLTVLGMSEANTVKAMNQLLVIVSPIVAVPLYWRQERVIPGLALLLSAGAIVGAMTGSWYSKTRLATLAHYRALFGLLTLFIAARLFYEATSRFRARHRKIR